MEVQGIADGRIGCVLIVVVLAILDEGVENKLFEAGSPGVSSSQPGEHTLATISSCWAGRGSLEPSKVSVAPGVVALGPGIGFRFRSSNNSESGTQALASSPTILRCDMW